MRLLADENFPKPIVEALRAEGHDVLWARTDLAGISDVALLDLAESEARIVMTLDKDFCKHPVNPTGGGRSDGRIVGACSGNLPRGDKTTGEN
jgi:hypothetical protein